MMKKVVLSLSAAVLLLSSVNVKADQLRILSKQQADAVVAFLKKQKQLVFWCACCDKDAKQLITVSGVSGESAGNSGYYLRVDGTKESGERVIISNEDLANIHYLSDGKAHNVGKALGFECDPCTQPFAYSAPSPDKEAAAASAEAANAASNQAALQAVMDRGRKFFEGGNNDKAIEDFTAAQTSPGVTAADKARSLYERGQAYYNKKEYDKSAADYTEAMALGMTGATIYSNRARAYAGLGDDGKAIADYAEAIRLSTVNNNKAMYYYNRGLAYMRLQEYDKAAADYTASLAIKPKDGDTYYSRGMAYFRGEKYDKAVADFEAAKKNTPSVMAEVDKALALVKAILHYQKAVAFAVKEDYANAIKETTEAINLQPDDEGYLWNRGVLYAEIGQYANARADIEAVLKKKPNWPGGKEMLDRINEQEKTDAAESVDGVSASGRVAAGQQSGPRTGKGVGVGQRGGGHSASPLRFYNRGLNAYNARDYDMAIASFSDAIKLNPRDAGYYGSRAAAYVMKRDYDRAIADYTEAIRLSPRRADFYAGRGDVYFDKGVHNRAITDYTEAIRFDPNNADYYCSRGDAYMSASDYRNATADFERALRLDPRHPDAQDLLRIARSQGRGYKAKPRGVPIRYSK